MARRNYRNNLEFVEAGFRACWENANALVESAKCLMEAKQQALALSVSVLALEELGKILCIDGLLFARADDSKSQAFAKSLKSHHHKLSTFELFPLFVGMLVSQDPRREEDSFAIAVTHSVTDLKDRGNVVLSSLPSGSFQELDRWKQAGFYAQPRGGSFETPATAVSLELATSVCQLAWRAVTTLDFLLKNGNLDRYIDAARRIRAALSEDAHQKLELAGEQLVDELYPDPGVTH